MARMNKATRRMACERSPWAEAEGGMRRMGGCEGSFRARTRPIDEDELHRSVHRERPCCAHATPSLRIDDHTPQELGRKGEDIAAYYLSSRGWEVLERNWTCPYGEADIIAQDDGEVVFVEVKTRLDTGHPHEVFPEIAVDHAKLVRYRNMMEHYASTMGLERLRFDVVAVSVVGERTAHIHHLVDAMEA